MSRGLGACIAMGCPDPSATGGGQALAAQQAESELTPLRPEIGLPGDPAAPVDGSDRRRVGAVAIVRALVAAVMLALAACGGGGNATPTAKPQASPTADPRTAVILRAYGDAIDAQHIASEIPDPNYPALEQTLIDPDLTRARHFILEEQQQGIVNRGTAGVQHHPRLIDVSSDGAVLLDCVYDTSLLVYAATGQPVPDQPGGTQPHVEGSRHTLRQILKDTWRLSDSVVTEGSCPPGY